VVKIISKGDMAIQKGDRIDIENQGFAVYMT
jgi:hypothetical protein